MIAGYQQERTKNMTKTATKSIAGAESKAPPVARIQVGNVQASIWARVTEKGTFHDVSFKRGYRTKDGWKNTYGFGQNDLLALRRAVGKAIDKLDELHAAAEAPHPTDVIDDDGPYISDGDDVGFAE